MAYMTASIELEHASGKVPVPGKNNVFKRRFSGKTIEKYPQTLEFELYGDKVDLLRGYGPGDKITVRANINGRETERDGHRRVWMTLSPYEIAPYQDNAQSSSSGYGDEDQWDDDIYAPPRSHSVPVDTLRKPGMTAVPQPPPDALNDEDIPF